MQTRTPQTWPNSLPNINFNLTKPSVLQVKWALGSKGTDVMHPPSTLVCLERPWVQAADGDDASRGVAFLMGLRYPGEYWVELALGWAEQGCPLNAEAIHELQRIAGSSSKQFSQQLRHRAAALLRRSASGVAAQPGAPADGYAAR